MNPFFRRFYQHSGRAAEERLVLEFHRVFGIDDVPALIVVQIVSPDRQSFRRYHHDVRDELSVEFLQIGRVADLCAVRTRNVVPRPVRAVRLESHLLELVGAVFVALVGAGCEQESDAAFDLMRIARIGEDGNDFALQLWAAVGLAGCALVADHQVDGQRDRYRDEQRKRGDSSG